MKSTCIKCKKSYDETEWTQYTCKMNTQSKRKYFHSMLCPNCHVSQNIEANRITKKITHNSMSKSFS